MKVGIIAWGSLITNSDELLIIHNAWASDGPMLPIEFARISKDKRITLVIYPPFEEVKTYCNVSTFENLDNAIENLAKREKTKIENIGFINFQTGEIKSNKIPSELKRTFSIWNINRDFDALIWTDLDENFKVKMNRPFSLEASIEHLKSLSKSEFELAKNYILSTPENTQTRHRKALTEFLKANN
jgi:hypothetical protein